jgi:hypothetical protein
VDSQQCLPAILSSDLPLHTLASVALLAALLVLALVAVHHQQATTDVAETQHASTALASYAPSRNRANRRAFKRNAPLLLEPSLVLSRK